MPKNPRRIKTGFDKTGVLIGFTKTGVPMRRVAYPSEIKSFFSFRSNLSPKRADKKYPIKRK